MNADEGKSDLLSPLNPADGLVTDGEWNQLGRVFGLSDREQTVAKLLFEGNSREKIALSLRKPDGTSLSPETVRVYIDRLMKKFNVADSMQFAIRVLRVLQVRQVLVARDVPTDTSQIQ